MTSKRQSSASSPTAALSSSTASTTATAATAASSATTPVKSNRTASAGPHQHRSKMNGASSNGPPESRRSDSHIAQKRPSIDGTVRHSNSNANANAGLFRTRAPSSPAAKAATASHHQQPLAEQRQHQLNDNLVDEQGAVACCGCGRRPRDRKYRRRQGPAVWLSQRIRNRRNSNNAASRADSVSIVSNINEFQDAASQVGSYGWPANDNDSMYFFDAEQDMLADDEYPIVFLTHEPPSKPYVTFQEPATLLSIDDPMRVIYEHDQEQDDIDNHNADGIHRNRNAVTIATIPEGQENDNDDDDQFVDADTSQHRSPSKRLLTIVRRPTLEHKESLQNPRIVVPIRGFPGSLTAHELQLCQRFIREVRQRPPEVAEQVYSLRDIEDEPYAICRWLRATKFDVDAILQRLEENKDAWTHAKEKDFFPNPNEAIGAPFSVFLTQYPFLSIGRAKNGCPVNYFQCGKIRPEGILCLTTLKHMESFFWYQFVHKFKVALRNAQAANPNVVRAEGVNVLDLAHLSTSALTSETFDVIKIASKISDFFPETLHCMIILNAPSFFSMTWGVIKKLMDPRTAARIQVFSSPKKGLARLRELVDESEIPADYGGNGPSVQKVLLREASKSSTLGNRLQKQESELLHIKRRNGKVHHTFQLAANQSMEVRIYTRSVSSAKFTVSIARTGTEKEVLKQVLIRGMLGTDPGTTTDSTESNVSLDPMVIPKEKLICAKIQGPGVVHMDGVDQDDVNHSKWKDQSRGYFLVVGNFF